MAVQVRKFALRLSTIVAVALIGVAFGSASKEANAQSGGCEDDACARVCFMGSCTGECFDDPGNDKKCNMDGLDCVVGGCNEQ